MKRELAFIILACACLALGACSALDKVGDKIDDSCEAGTLTVTQGYIDQFNDHLANKGRKFRVDGITCLE